MYKRLQTLPPSGVLSLQVALIEDPTLTFQSCLPLNISNLLPQPNTNHSLSHSCTETLEELLPHPSHIQEGTLPQAIYTWYTDAISFLHEGARRAGYAIVSDTEVVEAQALPAHTTNQQAELIALPVPFNRHRENPSTSTQIPNMLFISSCPTLLFGRSVGYLPQKEDQ